MDIFKQLLLQFILILLNAFFASTEIAVISLNEKKIKAKAEDGDKKAKKMLKMIEDPTRFLSTIQIGITLAGFLGSAFAADNFATRLSVFAVNTFSVSPAYAEFINDVSVIVITLVLSFFTLVLGELVPKRIAMQHKEKLAETFCGVIAFLSVALKPVIWLISISTNGTLRLFGIDPNSKEEAVSQEDIVIMLDAGADEGSLDENDIEYIKNVFKLEDRTAGDIMTPGKNVAFLSDDMTDEQIIEIIESKGFSRFPVYSENMDNIIGILHTRKYLLRYRSKDFKLDDVMHKPTFVSEFAHLDVIFKDMQKEHKHMVIVVNEYGETAGIVTMEDILEQLVGEIWDENDEVVTEFKKLSDDVYSVSAAASIEDFFEFFELSDDDETESATVNGWIAEQIGIIPEKDHSFKYKNLSITVTKADELMAHEIKVEVSDEDDDEQDDD